MATTFWKGTNQLVYIDSSQMDDMLLRSWHFMSKFDDDERRFTFEGHDERG